MINAANIICKTAGIAGMSAVVYDACANAKHHAHVGREEAAADLYERAFAAERTTTNQSHVTSGMQKRVSNMRMRNPILPFFGGIKGWTEGFVHTLGDNFVPVVFASLALAAKGAWQKAGAWGLAGVAVFKILREGFGVGKHTPIDD
jgi:hypothetical protein